MNAGPLMRKGVNWVSMYSRLPLFKINYNIVCSFPLTWGYQTEFNYFHNHVKHSNNRIKQQNKFALVITEFISQPLRFLLYFNWINFSFLIIIELNLNSSSMMTLKKPSTVCRVMIFDDGRCLPSWWQPENYLTFTEVEAGLKFSWILLKTVYCKWFNENRLNRRFPVKTDLFHS